MIYLKLFADSQKIQFQPLLVVNRRLTKAQIEAITWLRGRIAQLVRAPLLHRGGRGFEPLFAHLEPAYMPVFI